MTTGASRLRDKVAIVTGVAPGGTGHGIAAAFLCEGAQVIVSDIDEAHLSLALDDLAALGPVAGLVADVALRADADRTVRFAGEKFGRLDILVNNAALSTPGVMLEDMDDALIARNLGPSLYGTLYHMQAALPLLRRQGGSIINFASRNGILGVPGFSLYAAAKEAVRGLSRTAAREWGPLGIRVNVIAPATLSPGASAWLAANPDEAAKVTRDVALGYIGDPVRDVAPAAVFLASDEGRYVTGQTIHVDGGQVMP